MEMNPNDIELETMNKSFAYERMARDIDEIGDMEVFNQYFCRNTSYLRA